MTDPTSEPESGATAATAAGAATATEEPQDERTRVLRMVADGRITVDEAVELLKALQPEATSPGHPTQHEYAPHAHTHEHGNQQWGPWGAFGPFFGRKGPPGPGGPSGPPGAQWGRHDRARWEQRFGPFDVRTMKRGARGRAGRHVEGDVFFSAAAPPPGVPGAPFPPVPPVPPVPAVGPMGPIPPVPPMPPEPPFPYMAGLANRVLVFDVRDDDKRYNARLPLGLVGEIERFIPRQVRQALVEHEIDAEQLIELVNNMDPGHGGELIDIQDEEKRLNVRVEIPGHPELG